MASDVSSAIGGRSTQIVEKGVDCGENVAGAVGINLEWCGNTRNRGEIFVN
jgi:isopentenyl diphosphate isomerase/L-lactate dehydrogenase-like FMN-dependent dehydrogenase